jgi:protein-L-isoaspartate(D-aspartate) O-methyltransferase
VKQPDAQQLRADMVEHLRARGVRSQPVLQALRRVPREAFVGEQWQCAAYDDGPLPIDAGQTISQPYVVALMIEALQLQAADRVLEIGTGSGYAAALLACIARQVVSVERVPGLAASAAERLHRLGFETVRVMHGDGTLGWPADAPFDAILVSAAGPQVPPALQSQLSIGGRLVMPVGADSETQQLLRLTRSAESSFESQRLGGVRFVPLIGEQGWAG